MASGGSSGRPSGASRSFDFGADDVLCSYDDFAAQDLANGKRSDPSIKDFHEGRMGRPLVNIYEQDDYSKDFIINSVEKCMKKNADTLLRFLEGISGRLSQLEIHCYKLERSIGEFRSDIVRDQTEVDQKLKSLDKHVQEVHRSIQILRDKQELADTQKELAKLQMAQKESNQSETMIKQSAADIKNLDNKQDVSSQQLALVPSHQAAAPPVLPARPEQIQPSLQHQAPAATTVQQDQYPPNQSVAYYDQRQAFPQDRQSQTVHSQVQYVQVQPRSQVQDIPAQAPQQPQIINQSQAPPPVPQYQQQWSQQSPQQFPQQVVQPQQPAPPTQIRPQTPPPYSPYPSQPSNPVPETYMQVPYPPTVSQSNTGRSESVPFGFGGGSSVSQPNVNRPDPTGYGFAGAANSVSQPSQHPNVQRQMQPPTSQSSFGQHPSKAGYASNAPYPPAYNAQGYGNAYGYQPSNPQQVPSGNTSGHHNPQMLRNHPYGDMIEKAVGMGYGRDQVVSVIQRMADSGQPVDFNVLLDRLNGPAAGGNPRGW